jgi:hypothetical protein
MKVKQAMVTISAFTAALEALGGDKHIAELRGFAAVFRSVENLNDQAAVARIKANWASQGLSPAYPPKLKEAVLSLVEILNSAGAKKQAEGLGHFAELFNGAQASDHKAFLENIAGAIATRTSSSARPKAKKAAQPGLRKEYLTNLSANLHNHKAFAALVSALDADEKASDADVKAISKSLTGKGRTKRDAAIAELIKYQATKSLSDARDQELRSVGV